MADDHLPHDPPPALPRRVYQAEQVDRYIDDVHGRLEELVRQLEDARRRAERAAARAAAAAEAQGRLGETLLATQRAADTAVGDAERRARAILVTAEEQARHLLEEVGAQAQAIVNDANIAVDALVAAMSRPPEDGEGPAEPAAASPWLSTRTG